MAAFPSYNIGKLQYCKVHVLLCKKLNKSNYFQLALHPWNDLHKGEISAQKSKIKSAEK
jgi:hypothetical protein